MKVLKNMLNKADTAIEILHFHTNMNGLVFHADITKTNEKTNSPKYNVKKLILSID